MLEEILNKINTNLERMANALEGNNKLLKEPIGNAETQQEAVTANMANIVQTINQPVVPTIPVQEIPVQAMPTEVVAPTPAIPTTAVQESFTIEQLARAMSNAVSVGKMELIQGILKQFNVQALTQINPSDYNKLAVMLKEAGVEV